ncbi:unnamed protein product [Symbiodinium natans]|uniref:Fungal lipase-type domain-containing protein n=1 Tax=Symbiodinium natans TaxID=878477 RepID=A0A812U9F8_9DINO|nr:unnamed protein product [Symbiodinium natans]
MTKDGKPWTTLFRAPRMHAPSGAWLEAFSKWDAQAMLIAVPWTLLAVSLTFFVSVYAIEAAVEETAPSLLRALEGVIGILQYLVALCAVLYLPVALLLERPSSCCWASGPRRPPEGWFSLLAVLACAGVALTYARSFHTLPDRSKRLGFLTFVHGSLAFRAGATLEFLLQIAWLWAAAGLRCEEGASVPRWRRWSYFLLTALWMLTWWGPTDEQTPPSKFDSAVVVAGYSSRLILFVYCVARACRKCTRHIQCFCGCCAMCRDDWRCLENLPCTPGRARLRYLLYYLLTRPPFLIIMNLPIGYPHAFLASFALVVRCGLVLLVAIALRPAPSVKEHEVEVETRGKFDILLALRLCDFSCETYLGAPMPAVIVVSGCGHALLNGEYRQEGRDAEDHPEYVQSSGDGRLRFSEGTWEAAWAPSGVLDPKLRAYAEDQVRSPDQVMMWFEVHGEEHTANANMRAEPSSSELQRGFVKSGGCDQLDVQWLITEHHGCLAEEAAEDQGQPDEEAPAHTAEASISAAPRREDEVSLVVAFRGTNSVTNVATDLRISLTPLAEESKTGPFGSAHGQQPVCFDLKDKVKAKLSVLDEVRPSSTSTNPFSPSHRAQARAPLRDRQDSQLSDSADEDSDSDSWLSGCCRVLARCCSRLFFPFLPSDFEDDDEELSLEALERVRVHKGFAEAYAAVRADVLVQLEERLQYWHEKDVPVRVYATGHSLGGAIANLFALDLSAAPEHDSARRLPFKDPVVVYTFGSPRAGNASFRSVYNSLVPQTFRIVASRDVVPTLPPSIAYRQLGREVWVDDAGELTFVMSWAMRHILPARDSIWYHAMLSYFRLLNRSHIRKTGQMFPSAFRGEPSVREALDGKLTAS